MKSIWAVAVVGLAAACAPPGRQYTLRIDLADQSATQLCHRDSDAKAKAKAKSVTTEKQLPDEDCEAFGGQSLKTPGTLTVKLEHQSNDLQYDLRISQFSREANPSDAQRILTTVVQHASELAQLIANDRGKQVVADAAQQAGDKAPEVAAAVVGKIGTAAPETIARPAPDKVFVKPYFDGKKLASAAEARGKVVGVTNAPPVPYPPPRSYDLGNADLDFLRAAGVTADQLGDFVIEWCTPASFEAAADKERYDALATAPDPDDVREALGLSAQDVAAMLLARSTTDALAERVNTLLVEAKKWDTASAAAKGFATMRLGATLTSDLRHCEANIAFLQAKVTDAERQKLAAVPVADAFVKLRANAQKYAAAFDAGIAPLFASAFVESEKVVKLAGTDATTTITLDPGRLELGVGQTDAAGKRTEPVTYKMEARGIERLAILLGPMLTYCNWGCFDRVDQVAVQPTTPGEDVHAELQKSEHTHDFALATALHVTFWRFGDANFGLGGVLGYPIGSAKGTSSNFLVGLGLRHSSGLELSAGLHAFSARVLKSSYPEKIDLREAGNSGLTVDSVTEDEAQWAFFVMVGFAPDVFSAIKE